MFSCRREMDPIHNGVFYQAIPAVGADGKDIMKLIPVKMVNGQFFRSQTAQPKTDPTPQKAVIEIVKNAALDPPDAQQIVKKKVSLMKDFPKRVVLDQSSSLNKDPPQQKKVHVSVVYPMAKPAANSAASGRPPGQLPVTVKSPALPRGQYLQIPSNPQVRSAQMATPAANGATSGGLPGQLPVPVKSPALPRGQYLQIPSNAQVRSAPTPERPPLIKKQNLTSSANSASSGVPSVVKVSPANQGATPQSESALQPIKLLCKTSDITSCGPPSKESKSHLKLIPKVSQRPNSPMKWVIEEVYGSTAPTADPIIPSVSSEILRVVAERENASKHPDVLTKPVALSSQDTSGHGPTNTTNTVLIFDGKIFLVVENGDLPYKMEKTESSKAAIKSYEFNKTIVPSSQPSLESVAPQKEQGLTGIVPDKSSEVIDLCDDDAHSSLSQQAASVHTSAGAHPDEDNVIFVSYIPPRSESESKQDLKLETQTTLVKETEQVSRSSSDNVVDQKRPDGTTGGPRRRIPGQNMSVDTVKHLTHVCGSAVMNMHNYAGSNISSPQSTSTQQLESTEVHGETKSPADPINIAPVPVWIVKNAALNPSAVPQILKKKVSLMKAFPKQVGLDQSSSLNKHPPQQQKVNLSVAPPMATPAANSAASGRLPGQLPVTVKSPALPRGQYLQSPSNAQVRSAPAPERPPLIKKQNLTSSANSTSSAVPSVPKVSPANQGATPQSESALQPIKSLCKTSDITSCGPPSKESKPHLKLIPKVSQRPNSPMKWVIEEVYGSTAPTADPIIPSVSSEILRVVAKRENASKHPDVLTKLTAWSEQKILDYTRGIPGQSTSVDTAKNLQHVCGSAVMNVFDNVGSRSEIKVEPCAADPSTSDSSGRCSRIEKDVFKMESSMVPVSSRPSSLAESRQVSDDLLRQMFGITVDVKICLRRIDGASAGAMRSAEDHREPRFRVKEEEVFLQDLYSPQESDSCRELIKDKRVNARTEQEPSQDSTTPGTLSDTGPRRCLRFTLKKKQHYNTSHKGTSRYVEMEPMIGYVEPIDEDFLSTDENDTFNSQGDASRPQTHADPNAPTRRLGRTRKRTMCPCCIPGTPDPAVMSGRAKPEVPEKRARTATKKNKEVERGKAARKEVKTSGRMNFPTGRNKRSCKTPGVPTCDGLSTTCVDRDELKQHKQIQRLKELLKKKEEALERLRNSTS